MTLPLLPIIHAHNVRWTPGYRLKGGTSLDIFACLSRFER